MEVYASVHYVEIRLPIIVSLNTLRMPLTHLDPDEDMSAQTS